MQNDHKAFYDMHHAAGDYAACVEAQQHSENEKLSFFLDEFDLRDKKCVEIGCARGAFKDLVEDYTGVDISPRLGLSFQHPKKFVCASASALPLNDTEFDCLWSLYALEHIPDLPTALEEMRRVMKTGGKLFLRPAWNVPQWVATGVSVRTFSDLSLPLKILKFVLPAWNSRPVKGFIRLLWRLHYWVRHMISKKPPPLRIRHLHADYEHFWTSDSDACNGIDLFALALWFKDRGDRVLSPSSLFACFTTPSVPLVIEKGRDA